MTHYRTQEREIKREGKMSLETWRTDWIKTKRDIAKCLEKGACGLSHPLICWLSVPANKKSSLVPGFSVLIRC
jgi:hypothetical protein